MAENINISFAPNKAASESQRIADLEQYVSTLTERTKFAFASIIEEYNGADTDKTQQILNTIYQSTYESGSDVGQFTNEDQNSEIFNDYENNVAEAYYSHAEGKLAKATGYASHAEGKNCTASGNYSHAGGLSSEASGKCSYAGGELCTASGDHSHAEGWSSIASGECSYAMGKNNTITGGDYDTIIGKGNTIKNVLSNSEKGYDGTRYGQGSVVTGTSNTTVQSVNTLVSGRNNYVGRSYWNPAIDSLVVGSSNKINGGMDSSAVIGNANTTPSSENTDIISLSGSIVVGNKNKIESGDIVASTIIGDGNNAKLRVTAKNVKNSMQNSVIIGTGNTNESVQGAYTIGHFNHQFSASSAIITGKGQFAIGVGLQNGRPNNFAMGYYNKKFEKNGKELDLPFSFGGGTSDDDRKNLIELDWNGNLWIAGNLNEGGGGYVLPIATKSTLGGVKIGDNISVTADGTISVDLSSYLKSADISDWAKQSDKPTYTANEIGLGNVDNTADADKPISTATQTALDGKADTGHTHTVSDITDMPEYLTEETDPTVPAWAKQAEKPVYTADEVGAAAKKHTHNVSDITDMPEWTKAETKPKYTAAEIGAAAVNHTHNQTDIVGRWVRQYGSINIATAGTGSVTFTKPNRLNRCKVTAYPYNIVGNIAMRSFTLPQTTEQNVQLLDVNGTQLTLNVYTDGTFSLEASGSTVTFLYELEFYNIG